MKKGIHPTVFANAQTICACGAVHQIPNTIEEIKVDICAECHPFYTGKIKIIDTAGRIDKFNARVAAAKK